MLPIERPGKIVCVGLNYSDHAEEQGAELPKEPLLFAKWPSSLIGPGEPIVIPPLVTKADYEAELGVVIGVQVKGISKESAFEAVRGYLCANDVSARDLQFSDGQWTRGKSPDTFCPVGPMTPRDEITDPHTLAIRAIVNDEVLQDSTTANLIFGVDDVIAYVSQTTTLEPGDLILTGTPAGVGVFRDPQRLLQPGDEVTIEIDGLGVADQPRRRRMRLGLLTAPFPRRSLKRVAEWAAGEGFEMLEVACWPAAGGERRRYAGTSHIDVSRVDAGAVRDVLDRNGLEISSLAFYPNNLHPDPAERRAANTHLKKVIDAAAKLDVGIVGTFVGRDKSKNVPDNFREFRKVWPRLVDYAEQRGVKIAIENCPMIFSWDEWPGGTNLASSPAMWDEMFSIVDSPSFGLNLDPSHLVWLQIDYERVVRDYAPKIFHVHAKDMEIDRDGLYRNGTASLGMGWQVPRLPGLGEVRWDRFVAALYREGYDFVVSVEHEDRAFEATEELVKRGFLIARDTLKPLLH